MRTYAVQILFDGEWTTLAARFRSRGAAEWAIARWRQQHGSNGTDNGFRVTELQSDALCVAAPPTIAEF